MMNILTETDGKIIDGNIMFWMMYIMTIILYMLNLTSLVNVFIFTAFTTIPIANYIFEKKEKVKG